MLDPDPYQMNYGSETLVRNTDLLYPLKYLETQTSEHPLVLEKLWCVLPHGVDPPVWYLE
jgi:hypothetical protein